MNSIKCRPCAYLCKSCAINQRGGQGTSKLNKKGPFCKTVISGGKQKKRIKRKEIYGSVYTQVTWVAMAHGWVTEEGYILSEEKSGFAIVRAHGDPRSPHTMVVSPFRHSQCSPERAGVAWFYIHSHYFFGPEKHNCFWGYDFLKKWAFYKAFYQQPRDCPCQGVFNFLIWETSVLAVLQERWPRLWRSNWPGARYRPRCVHGARNMPDSRFFSVENLLWIIAFSERSGCNTEVSNGPDRHVHIGKCTSTPQFTYGKL